jgi:hypothetical protein
VTRTNRCWPLISCQMSRVKHGKITCKHQNQCEQVGASGVVLCVAAFAVPPHYPLCVLIPLLQISALVCSSVAAIRGNELWLILTVIAGLLTVRAVLFVLVDC